MIFIYLFTKFPFLLYGTAIWCIGEQVLMVLNTNYLASNATANI